MKEETDRTPEEMWADWARKELTDQAAELKELRRYKRETEKDLRRFKKYSAAMEKEVKTLREALEKIVIETNEYERRLPGPSMVAIRLYAEKALKGGAE